MAVKRVASITFELVDGTQETITFPPGETDAIYDLEHHYDMKGSEVKGSWLRHSLRWTTNRMTMPK